jgi:serine phosphatase RsbU (regulator of sigma subunit)
MVGVQLLSLGMTLSLINQLKWINLPGEFSLLSELAIVLGVPLAVSFFLARNFARTNRDLSAQLAQVEELSRQKIEHERHAAELRAENERRAKELEEARQLQLSMLPKKLPQILNLEIAAYMKPATEVGGDYYDFHVNSDGGLTVAVGDATGHGLKAGTVVTAAKTLFRNYADEMDIPGVFAKSSRVIKEMNLRGLFMAMTMLKIKDNRLVMCAAGMPSALVFRAGAKSVEEISIRAMPWGSPFAARYEQSELTLASGDTILLMSDGFPEMFSETGEMIGDGAAAEILREAASGSPQEIINLLVETGEKWAGARPADDDVTFVVIKMI